MAWDDVKTEGINPCEKITSIHIEDEKNNINNPLWPVWPNVCNTKQIKMLMLIIGHRNDRNNLVFRLNMNYETFNKISCGDKDGQSVSVCAFFVRSLKLIMSMIVWFQNFGDNNKRKMKQKSHHLFWMLAWLTGYLFVYKCHSLINNK